MKVKKIYSSPCLIVISLDRSTSLSMLSENTTPDDPFATSASPQSTPIVEDEKAEKSVFEETPFK